MTALHRLALLISLLVPLAGCSDDPADVPAADAAADSGDATDAAGARADSVGEDTGERDTSETDASRDGGVGDIGEEVAPDAGDLLTWTNFAETFFGEYCVSCHRPAGQARADFAQYSVVILRLNAIRCGVAPALLENCEGEPSPGMFPIGAGPQPTEDERSTLVDWIESGAPE